MKSFFQSVVLMLFAMLQIQLWAQPVNTPDYPLSTELNIDQFNASVFIHPNDKSEVLNAGVKMKHISIGGGAYIFETQPGQSLQTINGGASWVEHLLNSNAVVNGYPTAQINMAGRYFIGYTAEETGQVVSWSDNRGATWNDVIVKQEPTVNFKYVMQNHLWIDNSERSMYSGNAYAAWRYVGVETSDYSIEFSRSTDNGLTWENARVISSNATQGDKNEQWPAIQTGPNGEVYVCWAEHEFSGNSWEKAIGFTTSLSGGNNFWYNYPIQSNIRGTSGYVSAKSIELNSAPGMAVDISGGLYDGRIYVAWANVGEPGINTGQDIDIYMITSDTHGNSWSLPVRVNQNPSGQGKEHLFPAITCDAETGTLTVIYYDDRNVASNMAELWGSISYDGGSSFTDFKISDVSYNFDNLIAPNGNFISKKIGVHASHGKVYPVWADFREGPCRTVTSPFDEKNISAPENLEAGIINWTDGTVLLDWEMPTITGLQYFNIYRNNQIIATTNNTEYSENLPDFGKYTYKVSAQFAQGESSHETAFVSWGNSEFVPNKQEFDIELAPGDETTLLMNIANGGTLPVDFNISFSHDPAANPSKDGGPDDFGYTWMDNFEPGGPVFDYTDISGTGVEITGVLNDNFVGPFPTGFSFPFYDNYYDEFYISSNGLITFGGSFANPVNSPIPTTDGNNNFIAWCWDNLQQKTGGQVYYQQFDQYTIIQFKDYAQNGTLSLRYTIDAEVVLYKNGNIKIQYLDHTAGLFITNSCTIGIENQSGNDGLQVAYNQMYLDDGLAVMFYNPGLNWISILESEATIQPGESMLLAVDFSAAGYSEGDYFGNIIFNTTAENSPVVIIPAHMKVTTAALQPPTNLDYDIVGNNVTLNWNAPSVKALLGYNVYESGIKVNGGLVVSQNYLIENLAPGLYIYQVTAVYSQGESNPEGNLLYVFITASAQQEVQISGGWSGISSYIEPFDADMEAVFSEIESDVVVVMGESGLYWPAQNINTIGTWNNQDGYKVKLSQQRTLHFAGNEMPLPMAGVSEGWNLIPVLSICEVTPDAIFAFGLDELVIIKEVAGTDVYWPSMGIFSLETLKPGKAYELLLSGAASLFFPDCEDGWKADGSKAVKMEMPWNEPSVTGSSHTIAITGEAVSQLLPGDILGVFNETGLCTGAVEIESVPAALTVFGDDITTREMDGMPEGEAMKFRLYRPIENKEYEVEVTFSSDLPNAGGFANNGLSAIQTISFTVLDVDAINLLPQFEVYPNPSSGSFNIGIRNLSAATNLKIINTRGQVVFEKTVQNANFLKLNLDLPEGVYFLNLQDALGTQTKKIIIST